MKHSRTLKSKAELVLCLLSRIRILEYWWTGHGTSNIYLFHEDNRSSIFLMRLKFEIQNPRRSLLLAKKDLLEKEKLDFKKLKMKKCMFEVK